MFAFALFDAGLDKREEKKVEAPRIELGIFSDSGLLTHARQPDCWGRGLTAAGGGAFSEVRRVTTTPRFHFICCSGIPGSSLIKCRRPSAPTAPRLHSQSDNP